MAYSVRITPRAERDFTRLFTAIDGDHSETARQWYRGLREAMISLGQSPRRCPATLESRKLRHLLYGHRRHVYRVIYRVLEKQKIVEVLHIRHGAMRGLKAGDVE